MKTNLFLKLERYTSTRFIKENNIKDIAGIEESLKRMFSSVIEEMLEAELEDQLGYSKYDYKSKTTDNSRNGRTKKTVNT